MRRMNILCIGTTPAAHDLSGLDAPLRSHGGRGEQSVPLILMIHDAPNSAMKKALAKISKLPVVKAPPVLLRVETFD